MGCGCPLVTLEGLKAWRDGVWLPSCNIRKLEGVA